MTTRIAVEARIWSPESAGGVAQVIMSLAAGLSKLDGEEEYIFVGFDSAREWLAPMLSGPSRLHCVSPGLKERLAHSALGPALIATREVYRSLSGVQRRAAASSAPLMVATSDGVIEALGADLVHFPYQRAYLTDRPNLYHPHDLQHVHLPELFDAETLRWRARNYRRFCSQANFVVVESSWTKRDVMQHFGTPEEKISVIPMPPPQRRTVPAEAAAAELSGVVDFPRFIFYPALTWPHKNHVRLIEALAILKSRHGLTVPFVGTGGQAKFHREVMAKVEAAGLSDQVLFLGFVDDVRLAALYQRADIVVVPSRFESISLPIWEAFAASRAVVCSNVTSLPEQVADAALVFDPDDPDAIALAIKRLWEDGGLREKLAGRGRRRFDAFSWDTTARQYRALYRRALGRKLDAADAQLLSAPPQL